MFTLRRKWDKKLIANATSVPGRLCMRDTLIDTRIYWSSELVRAQCRQNAAIKRAVNNDKWSRTANHFFSQSWIDSEEKRMEEKKMYTTGKRKRKIKRVSLGAREHFPSSWTSQQVVYVLPGLELRPARVDWSQLITVNLGDMWGAQPLGSRQLCRFWTNPTRRIVPVA